MSQRVEQSAGFQFKDVEKRYGPLYALRRLTLEIFPGECVALTGRNGSGKTTLLRIATQLARPTGGSVTYTSLKQDELPATGYVSHSTMLYDELTAKENLLLFARLLEIENPTQRVTTLLAETGLSSRAASLVRTFSRGMKQRLAIARALLHDPTLLFFDEPGTGLDAESMIWLVDTVRSLRDEGRTIVMNLHGESRLSQLATRAARLEAGNLVADTRSGATVQSVFALGEA